MNDQGTAPEQADNREPDGRERITPIDLSREQATLSPTQYAILAILAEAKGACVKGWDINAKISTRLYGRDMPGYANSARYKVHISRMRKLLLHHEIQYVVRNGYRLVALP